MASTQFNQIYVGDLPALTDEAFLRTLFNDCGAILPNGIILKKHKSLEKAFAFITFETHDGAAHAISEVNYTKLDGVPIRISWSDPETKKIRNSGLGNLFIRGLDESIEVSQLHDAFSNFGEIISCKIPMSEGKSRGYGYIQFRNPADAEKARVDLQDASINGKPITIEPYVKPTKKNPEENFTNVFIKGDKTLKLTCKSNEELSKIFEPFGEIQNARLMMDEKNESKGFGFCNFKHHEDAVKAVEGLDGTEVDGIKVVVCRAMSKNERKAYKQKKTEEYRRMKNAETKGRNLYVKNFGTEVTDEEFEEFFKQFGEIENFKIAKTSEEPFESKGFGFVCYKTKEEANKAIMETPTTPLKGQELFVTLFKNKEDRMREKAKETRAHNVAKEFKQMQAQFPMTQMQAPVQQMQMPMQMPMGAPMSAPMMGMMGMMGVPTMKDRLKQELLDRNITGQALKAKLSSVSEDQAKILCDDQDKLTQWLQ
jgi:polyadenylate-binding protein